MLLMAQLLWFSKLLKSIKTGECSFDYLSHHFHCGHFSLGSNIQEFSGQKFGHCCRKDAASATSALRRKAAFAGSQNRNVCLPVRQSRI